MHEYLVKIYPIYKWNGEEVLISRVISDCPENAIVSACKKWYTKRFYKELIKDIECYDLGVQRE